MKQFLKIGVALSALAILAASALAGPITGTWRGRLKIDASRARVAQTADLKHRMNKAQQAPFSLTLNPNHTFSIAGTGVPSRSGTWTTTGNSLTLQGSVNGKNIGAPEVYNLSKDGKTLSMSQRVPSHNIAVTVVFSR
ncbi:MAG: hypothetical protein P4L46_13865 [Fimbriimonas sp.]|nr:hypothetical protein [Fimbriimonas sp.]